MTSIALVTYRWEGLRAFLVVAIGFALITMGSIIEIAYEFGAENVFFGGVSAFGRGLFLLRTVEEVFIAAGLLLLI